MSAQSAAGGPEAQPEEVGRGDQAGGGGEADPEVGDERGGDVGQHLAQGDGPAGFPAGDGRFHVALGGDFEGGGPHDAGDAGHVGQRHCQEHDHQPPAGAGGQDGKDEERREGHDDIEWAHEDVIEQRAGQTGGETDAPPMR